MAGYLPGVPGPSFSEFLPRAEKKTGGGSTNYKQMFDELRAQRMDALKNAMAMSETLKKNNVTDPKAWGQVQQLMETAGMSPIMQKNPEIANIPAEQQAAVDMPGGTGQVATMNTATGQTEQNSVINPSASAMQLFQRFMAENPQHFSGQTKIKNVAGAKGPGTVLRDQFTGQEIFYPEDQSKEKAKKDKRSEDIRTKGVELYNKTYTDLMQGGLVANAPDMNEWLSAYEETITGGEKKKGGKGGETKSTGKINLTPQEAELWKQVYRRTMDETNDDAAATEAANAFIAAHRKTVPGTSAAKAGKKDTTLSKALESFDKYFSGKNLESPKVQRRFNAPGSPFQKVNMRPGME